MDDYRPQDEYFEWDDIMVYKGPSGDDTDAFKPSPLRYHPTGSRTFSFDSSESFEDDFSWSDDSSLSTTPSSLSSSDSLSLCSLKEDKTDADLDFPSYDDSSCPSCVTMSLPLSLTAPPSPILDPVSDSLLEHSAPLSRTISRGDIGVVARDDSALTLQPFRNLNYLTHNWSEEDIPSTWRYVVSRRADWDETASRRKSIWKPLNNIPRYENALWRSWAQRRFQLKTVSPETINWMKSCDETTLYGPFMMKASDSKVTSDCVRSENLPRISCKPLLKRPKMSEILLRGSIPTFVSTRHINNETHQTSFQAKPSYDPSVACPGMSVDQRRELTSVALSKLGLRRSVKSVSFCDEVEQCEIIKVRVSSKNMRRTLKKLPFTTLDKSTISTTTTIKTAIPFSPYSLWSHNPENSPEKEKDENTLWSGIVSEDEITTLRPAPIRVHKSSSSPISTTSTSCIQSSTKPELPPRSKHHRTSSIISAASIQTALQQHLENLKYESQADSGLDDLLYTSSSHPLPASPPSLDSSSGCGSSDDDDFPFFGSGDITDEKVESGGEMERMETRGGGSVYLEKSAREVRGMAGVRVVGEDIEDENERLRLRHEMEEFDLVLG